MSYALVSTRRLAGLLLGLTMIAGASFAADKLSTAELKKLSGAAHTPADHLKLARHYDAVAAEHEAEAQSHEALADQYAKAPSASDMKHPMAGKTAAHCRLYAEHCRKLAATAKEIAEEHRMASKGAAPAKK